jgi:hypothetical protein
MCPYRRTGPPQHHQHSIISTHHQQPRDGTVPPAWIDLVFPRAAGDNIHHMG